jgi:hypothetical protein
MKTTKVMIICGIAAALTVTVGASAQTNTINTPHGPITIVDTARQRYLQQVHDGLGLTNAADWNAVQPLVEKVFFAQRDLEPGGGRLLGPVPIHRGSNTNNATLNGHPIRFRQGNPEANALQSALDNQASADEIKTALEAYRASQKAKRANLAEAQENLRQALTIQQEAQAVLLRVLD